MEATRRVIRYGSLFSGIGAFDVGIEAAFGGRLQMAWNCERDEYPRRVLKKHFPNATQFTDVREVGARNLEPVEIIIASPPCTDISFAGKRAGLAGDHSSLWFEYMRIIRELRPRLCLFENTFSACSPIRERGTGKFVEQAMLGRVLGDLAESGYDAWWRGVRVSDVDGPHKRDRLFVVAYATGKRERESADEAHTIAEGWEARTVASGRGESRLVNADDARHGGEKRSVRARRDPVVGAGSREGLADSTSGARLREASREAGHAALGREKLADSDRRRFEEHSEPHGRTQEQEQQTSRRRDADGRDPDVADASSRRLESSERVSRRRSLANVDGEGTRREDVADSARERMEVAGEDEGSKERSTASGSDRRSRSTVAELDRDVGRSANRMDRTDADRRREKSLERHFARGAWPARPGEAQREDEPPRTEQGIDFRAQRLKAIGNVVSPPVALAVGLVAKAIWEHLFDE